MIKFSHRYNPIEKVNNDFHTLIYPNGTHEQPSKSYHAKQFLHTFTPNDTVHRDFFKQTYSHDKVHYILFTYTQRHDKVHHVFFTATCPLIKFTKTF